MQQLNVAFIHLKSSVVLKSFVMIMILFKITVVDKEILLSTKMEEIINISKEMVAILNESEDEIKIFTSFQEDIRENKGLLNGMQFSLQSNIDGKRTF